MSGPNIDLDAVRRSAGRAQACDGGRLGVVVSPGFLLQVADELEQCRRAQSAVAGQAMP